MVLFLSLFALGLFLLRILRVSFNDRAQGVVHFDSLLEALGFVVRASPLGAILEPQQVAGGRHRQPLVAHGRADQRARQTRLARANAAGQENRVAATTRRAQKRAQQIRRERKLRNQLQGGQRGRGQKRSSSLRRGRRRRTMRNRTVKGTRQRQGTPQSTQRRTLCSKRPPERFARPSRGQIRGPSRPAAARPPLTSRSARMRKSPRAPRNAMPDADGAARHKRPGREIGSRGATRRKAEHGHAVRRPKAARGRKSRRRGDPRSDATQRSERSRARGELLPPAPKTRKTQWTPGSGTVWSGLGVLAAPLETGLSAGSHFGSCPRRPRPSGARARREGETEGSATAARDASDALFGGAASIAIDSFVGVPGRAALRRAARCRALSRRRPRLAPKLSSRCPLPRRRASSALIKRCDSGNVESFEGGRGEVEGPGKGARAERKVPEDKGAAEGRDR